MRWLLKLYHYKYHNPHSISNCSYVTYCMCLTKKLSWVRRATEIEIVLLECPGSATKLVILEVIPLTWSWKTEGTQSRWEQRNTCEIGYILGDSARPDWYGENYTVFTLMPRSIEPTQMESLPNCSWWGAGSPSMSRHIGIDYPLPE